MKVRAKFKVTTVSLYAGSSGSVEMSAVTPDASIPENERFHKYTPSATVKMSIDNPPVMEAFKALLGKDVYVDFTPVEP